MFKTVFKGLEKGLEEIEIRSKIKRKRSNYCIFEIGPNIEKSPGDLKRLAVTQTLGKR